MNIYTKKELDLLRHKQLEDIKLLKNMILSFINSFEIEDVVPYMESVLLRCDEINYNDRMIVLAYVILHLLDRYHRFQYMQRIMLKKRVYIKKPRPYIVHHKNGSTTKINRLGVLDIGTGPAPALFAFDDFYEWIKAYKQVDYEVLCDYVELSEGFRMFIHFFVEHIMKYGDKKYNIPFHNGTYKNINGIDPRVIGYDDKFKENILCDYKDIKKHYDVIIASNFFTNEDIINKYNKDLKNAMNMIRDNGFAIFVGAKPIPNTKYENVYKIIDEIVSGSFKYRKNKNGYKYTGKWKKVIDEEIQLSYRDTDIGLELIDYYTQVKDLFVNKKIWNDISPKVKSAIESGIKGQHHDSWKLVIYKKHVVNHELLKKNINKKR